MNDDALIQALSDPKVQAQAAALSDVDRAAFFWRMKWLTQAHDHQIMPPGDWWSIWLLCAGRGAGKTRLAAEQIGWLAWSNPGTRALVAAPTSSDVRGTCFEGDSGLLSVIPPILIEDYNKSLHELKLKNGSLIKGIPASEPERFRGPQFHFAWCCIPGTLILMEDGSSKPIELIAVGDRAMTRHGPRSVLAAGRSQNPNDLVTIECGLTSLTLTSDHPILVGGRWIPAGEIKPGDELWVTSTLADATLTESSTSSTTDQSLMAGWFTTGTRTRATTTQPTLKQCLEVSICAFTRLARRIATINAGLLPQQWPRFVRQSLASVWSAALGLSQRLLASQGSSAQDHALKDGAAIDSCQSSVTASSAVQSIWPSNDSRGTAASSVTTDLKCGHIELRPTVVRRAERSPNAITYNLTVDGEHEFIANGIVVHNCDELAAWDYLQQAWDQIQFGLRLGKRTIMICTTTPRPKDLIIDLIGRDGDDVVVTTASTYTNLANLSPNFQRQILQYEGTKLGRQEIFAEIIDPEESGIVKRDMFKLWPADKPFPKFEFIVQSYDCAYTEKTKNDPTACITYGVFKPIDDPMAVMVIDCWQDRLQYPDLRPKVIEEFDNVYGEGKDRKRVDLILVEDKSAGISLIQDLQRAHLPVRSYNPGGADKMQRLNIVSNVIARGRVWIPESTTRPGYVRDWAEGMVSQLCAFPETTHDDFVDCTSQGLRFLRDSGWISIDSLPRDDYDDDDYADSSAGKKRVNPYAA